MFSRVNDAGNETKACGVRARRSETGFFVCRTRGNLRIGCTILATLGSSDVPGRSQKLGDNADILRF